MGKYSEEELQAAHKQCTKNARTALLSNLAGCFYCQSTYPVENVVGWITEKDGEGTARCPECGIDSVLFDAGFLPVSDKQFLAEMHAVWFGRTVSLSDLKKLDGS